MSPAASGASFFPASPSGRCNPARSWHVKSGTGTKPEGPHMKLAAFVVFAFLAFVVWAGSPVSFAADGHNVSSVNGSVRGEDGQTYGKLSTVNGNVRVGRGATADAAKTVNGEIVVEDD